MSFAEFENVLSEYSELKESGIVDRHIKHSTLEKLLKKKEGGVFKSEILGTSVEGRNIYRLSIGSGKRKVLMWTQMHGDEPTATLSILDMLNFFIRKSAFDEIKNKILEELTIYIIPMLNPDGAERITRFNALGIDLNRDAIKLESPESKILYTQLAEIKPEFAFNLHDQDIRWSVGDSNYPASVSLLAPPADYSKTIEKNRLKAIKLTSQLYEYLFRFMPNRIAKYSDDHEPRSFGDTAAKLGASAILIEAGKEAESAQKENIRKTHFALLIYSLISIVRNEFESYSTEIYNSIPYNGKLYYDLLIRNLSYTINGKTYNFDLGVNREEFYDERNDKIYYKGIIDAVGDLSNTFGLEEMERSGWELKHPRVYTDPGVSLNQIDSEFIANLLNEGYLFIQNKMEGNAVYDFPFNVSWSADNVFNILAGTEANFTLLNGSEEMMWIINGFPVGNTESLNKVLNGIIKK